MFASKPLIRLARFERSETSAGKWFGDISTVPDIGATA
jgi:hypothetical protein